MSCCMLGYEHKNQQVQHVDFADRFMHRELRNLSMFCYVGIWASAEGTTRGQALAMHPCFALAAKRNPAFWLSPSSDSYAVFGQAIVHTQARVLARALTEGMEMVTAFAGGGGRYVVLLTALCRRVGVLNLASRRKYLRMVALSRGQVERAMRWSDLDVSE